MFNKMILEKQIVEMLRNPFFQDSKDSTIVLHFKKGGLYRLFVLMTC